MGQYLLSYDTDCYTVDYRLNCPLSFARLQARLIVVDNFEFNRHPRGIWPTDPLYIFKKGGRADVIHKKEGALEYIGVVRPYVHYPYRQGQNNYYAKWRPAHLRNDRDIEGYIIKDDGGIRGD